MPEDSDEPATEGFRGKGEPKLKAWRSVGRLIANTHRFIDGARAAVAAAQQADAGARLSELERSEVSRVAAAARGKLRPEQLPLLVLKLTEGLEPQVQLAVAQRALEAMPLEALVPVSADLLASFSEAQLRALAADLGQDNDGADCLERLKAAVVALPAVGLSRHFQTASPRARLDHLELLKELLSPTERSTLLSALGAVPAMASPSGIPAVGAAAARGHPR